ncbi:MAG: hypothetical protein VCF07_05260 [Nitrospinota bacterium]
MKDKWRLILISAAVFLSAAAYSLASEHEPPWAKANRSKNPLTDVRIYKGPSGASVAFARTNMAGQFIEVVAYGTNDPNMTVSDSHAISLALATARAIAYEKLAEQVGQVRVSSTTLVRNELIQVKGLKIKVDEIIKGARILDEKYKKVGPKEVRALVKLGLLISGGPSNLLRPMYALIPVRPRMATPPAPPAKSPAPTPPPAQTETPAADSAPAKAADPPPETPSAKAAPPEQYTSLIIDASGIGARPALFPRILSADDKKVVYDRRMVEKMIFLQSQSIVKYSSSLEKAKASYASFIGASPLIIAASGTDGSLKADLLVSPEDSEQVLAANGDTGFLKKARVVLILN